MPPAPPRQPNALRKWAGRLNGLPAGWAAAVLAVLGWAFTLGLDRCLDLQLWDETTYLTEGLALPAWPTSIYYALAYNGWYKLLSFFQPEPLLLYFLNTRILLAAVPLAAAVLMRRWGTPTGWAFALGLGLLFSHPNVYSWPRVSHFYVAFCALGLAALHGLRWRMYERLLGMSLMFLLASYIRPEAYISFLAALALALACAIWEGRRPGKSPVWRSVLIVAVMVGTHLWLGTIFFRNERKINALSQHYALNYTQWNNTGENPWRNSRAIFQRDFGPVETIGQALKANPAAFQRHIRSNTEKTVRFLAFAPGEVLVPSAFVRLPALAGLALWMGLLAAGAVLAWKRLRRGKDARDMENNFRAWFPWVGLGLLGGPVLLSSILIYPREHYLIILLYAAVLLLGLLLSRAGPAGKEQEEPRDRLRAMLEWAGLALAAGGLAAFLFAQPRACSYLGNKDQPFKSTAETLAALRLPAGTIVDAAGGIAVYAGPGLQTVEPDRGLEPLPAFLKRNRVQAIVLSKEMTDQPAFAGDTAWQNLVRNPALYGFARADSGQGGFPVLYRKP